ncbi:hypothetical protein JCM10213_001802 [Rhodosporidiobolus nylandii]
MDLEQEIHSLLGNRLTLHDLHRYLKEYRENFKTKELEEKISATSSAFDYPGYWWAALSLVQRWQLLGVLHANKSGVSQKKARDALSGEGLARKLRLQGYARGKHYEPFHSLCSFVESRLDGWLGPAAYSREVPDKLTPRQAGLLLELTPSEQHWLTKEFSKTGIKSPAAAPIRAIPLYSLSSLGVRFLLTYILLAGAKHATQHGEGYPDEEEGDPEKLLPLDDDDDPHWPDWSKGISRSSRSRSPPRSRSRSRGDSQPHSSVRERADRLWSPGPLGGSDEELELAHPVAELTKRQAARYGTTPPAWAARAARTAFL